MLSSPGDIYVGKVPVKGTDPALLPFDEWQDSDINTEKWEPTEKVKEPTEAIGLFEDPQAVHLPFNIVAHEWKRPSEIFPNANFVVYSENPVYPDLISGSKHLLQSEFIRCFISSIESLLYLGNTDQFYAEAVIPSFSPNTGNHPWRPWHHIYSKSKAGKGSKHLPVVNNFGKYIVRLFWMGCWRKIYVDDRVPIDKVNHVLLPSMELTKEEKDKKAAADALIAAEALVLAEELVLEDKTTSAVSYERSKLISNKSESKKLAKDKLSKSKKTANIIQLWPLILSKALLKIASLTCYEENELVDFDIIQCLTGWIPQKINTSDSSINNIWEVCVGYTNHFTWSNEGAGGGRKVKRTSATITSKKDKNEESSVISAKKSEAKKSGSSKKSKDKSGKKTAEETDDDGKFAYHLVARCDDLRNLHEDAIPDITPCWSHNFLIDQTRDVPLIKPPDWPELPFWKTFRWIQWALDQGILAEKKFDPIKCFKIVSPFKKFSEHIIYRQPSKMAQKIQTSVELIDDFIKQKKSRDKKSSEKSSKESKQSKESAPTSKGSSGTKSTEGKKKAKMDQTIDTGIWIDYENLARYINSITIYFKPERFNTQLRITDLSDTPENIKGRTPQKENVKTIFTSLELRECRNEPFYIFCDSLDNTLIVINLTQIGNIMVLDEPIKYSPSIASTEIDANDCVTENLFYRVKNYFTAVQSREDSVAEMYSLNYPISPGLPKSHIKSYIVVEKYDWRTDSAGQMLSSLNTFGSKTLLIDLPPGRHTLKLWIRSDVSFLTSIMSKTKLVVGDLQDILMAMTEDSYKFTKMCHNISNGFGLLVQSFGMPEYADTLKQFYSIYKPNHVLPKKDLSLIHDVFYDIFYDMVREVFKEHDGQNIMKAFRILFLKFNIPISANVNATETEECFDLDEIENNDYIYYKLMQRFSAKLQALFRGAYQRLLMKRHQLLHKDYTITFENLKHIYTEMFSFNKLSQFSSLLLRRFLTDPKISHLYEYYDFANDLESVVTLYSYGNVMNGTTDSWLMICRYLFFVNSPHALTIKINLFCELTKYYVRVFNNDTKQEVNRIINNVAVQEYESNVHGYIVLCYGTSNGNMKKIPWKLTFAIKKNVNPNLLLIEDINFGHHSITDNYLPSHTNIIFKYIITVKKDTFLTIRLQADNQNAVVILKLMDDCGKILAEISGAKNVILPVLRLETAVAGVDNLREIKQSPSMVISGYKVKRSNRRNSRDMSKSSVTSLEFKKKISEKSSKRSSSNNFKRPKDNARRMSFQEPVVFKERTFILEGYIRAGSWLLNKKEWSNVERLRQKKLCGPNCFARQPSLINFGGRRSLVHKTPKGMQTVEGPLWNLQVISSSDDIILQRDESKDEEFRAIKRGWYSEDTNRYEESKKLRERYYAENRTIAQQTSAHSKESEVTLHPPEKLSNELPPYDLTKYFSKSVTDITLEQRIDNMKTIDDFRQTQIEDNTIYEENEIKLCENEFKMREYLEYQTQRFNLLSEWYKGCQEDSAKSLADSLKLRERYITNVLKKVSEKGEKKKKDKGKKDKKAKPGK